MNEKEKPKVRVLFPQEPAQMEKPASPEQPLPRVLSFEEKRETTAVPPVTSPVVKPLFSADASAKLPLIAASGPTTLNFAGMFVRRRLEFSIEQLKSTNPDVTSDESFQKAAEAIRIVNLDDPQSTKFLDFGIAAQQRFAEVAQQILDVTAMPVIDQTRNAVRTVADLIAQTNPEQLFKTSSGFVRFFEGKPNFENARQGLLQRLEEIKNRSKLIQRSLIDLGAVSQKAGTLHQRLSASLVDVEAVMVAARFLIEYLRVNQNGKSYFAEWAEMLERRVSSVVTTRLTLLQAFRQLDVLEKSLCHFTETVNHALVNLVPAWYGSCVAVLSNVRFEQDAVKVQGGDAWRNLSVLRDQILRFLRTNEREKNTNEVRS